MFLKRSDPPKIAATQKVLLSVVAFVALQPHVCTNVGIELMMFKTSSSATTVATHCCAHV